MRGGNTIIAISSSQLPTPHAKDACRKCNNVYGYLARYIQIDGQVAVRWVCDWCEDYKTSTDLPLSILGGVPVGDIPLRVDRSEETRGLPECCKCGEQSTEFHHWAPKAIFPDWPDLGVYLCVGCHVEWHTRMRAHGLRWPHELVEREEDLAS